MADLKISALPSASVALAGTEVLPIVQSSATKQVTVANLTAGRAVATGALTVTGDATLSTGNLVIGTSGKGIDFSATSGTGTSELLADYEEGTWTPTPINGTFNVTYASGFYTKVGRQVTATCFLVWDSISGSGNFSISLPFAILSTDYYRGAITIGNSTALILAAGYAIVGTLDQGATQTDFYFLLTNNFSQRMNINNLGSSGNITFTASYMV